AASMRAWSSTNATTSTAFCIRCAWKTCACSATPRSCFPIATPATSDAVRRRETKLHAQLLVERGLQLEPRRLVVQSRTVEQENVLGALAQRIDLGAFDVDVRLGERIGNARQQTRPVAGDDLEDEVRSLVVGKDADFGRERKMPQMTADASLGGELERRPLGQGPLQLELDVADRLAIAGVGVRRVMHDEGVERIAVPRRMDLGFENRQPGPAEKAADARKELFLVRQVDHQLQA